ncbi:MAG: SGNH/GDSL hydrolase family protein [Flavobacteriales bacterium]
MRKSIFIILLLLVSFSCKGQGIIGAVSGQHKNVRTTSIPAPPVEPSITRFIIIGASIMNSTFFYPDDIEALINVTYPDETVEVYDEAVAGWTTHYGQINIDAILAEYSAEGTTYDTYVLIHLGGNDVTNNRPYSTDTNLSDMEDDYNYMLDAIIAKGFTPILNEISFRNYDETTLLNEQNGSLPYNENIIKPLNLSRGLDFVFEDGTSYYQLYELIYNNPSWLNSDDIHVNNVDGLRDFFVNTICKYVFTGVPPTKLVKENTNLPEEIDYYSAYELPLASASTLQSALDTYGSVRLQQGDYTASGAITMTSNQKLYGYLGESGTKLGGHITIASGSTNVHVENINGENSKFIYFQSGSPITNCTLKSIYYNRIYCTDCQIEDNLFIDLSRVTTNFDCGTSGYFRNNIFLKAFQQAYNDQVIMIGNDATPSYGNLEIGRNILTNTLDVTNYDNLDSHTIVGFDAESWGLTSGAAGRAAFYFRNIGKLMLDNASGGSASGAIEYDVEADEFVFIRKDISSEGIPILRANTKALLLNNRHDSPTKESGVWEFLGHNDNDISLLNDVDVSTALTGTDATNMQSLILGTEYTPLPKPTFPTAYDITGATWATDRIGQADDLAYIQNLVDTNGIAELDEGIYYVSGSIIIQDNEGVVGMGTGKTAIVGLTDDFPVIHCQDDISSGSDPEDRYAGNLTNATYKVSNLTLQGGNVGIYVQPIGNEINMLQVTNTPWRNIVFRDQAYGIHVDGFYGLDNNMFVNLIFDNCGTAFKQTPYSNPYGSGEWERMMYVDKTVFYQCQFIDCDTAIDMQAIRANNLNGWIDCLFQGNGVGMITSSSNNLYVANSIFKENNGDYLIGGGAGMSFYSCDFTDNTTSTLFSKADIYMEGCNLNDNIPFNTSRTNGKYYLWNNNINGTFTLSHIDRGFLMNNTVTTNSALNKLMIEVIDGTATTLLNVDSNTYPQLLVTH